MITREDALLMIGKLCERPIRCCVRAADFELWATGTLTRMAETLRLESPSTALEIRLSDEMAFEYATGSAGEVVSGLGISLPLRVSVTTPDVPPRRDKIFLLELAE